MSVIVVGGGLTGLALAWRLRERADVTLLEAGARLGGTIHTVELAGVSLDVGADAFLARQPAPERLARDAGFTDEDLVAPAAGRVLLQVGGVLRPLPERTMLGVPGDLGALVRSGVLDPWAMARAAAEPLLPGGVDEEDRSVAELVGSRFGTQVVERLVEPLLGGVHAGRADRLSAQAVTPELWALARGRRSLLLGLAARRRGAGPDVGAGPVFLTLRGGLGRLVQRLVDDLGERVHPGVEVTRVAPVAGPGGARWLVETRQGTRRHADRVVLAVPATRAATLLRHVAPAAARELSQVRHASVAVVALAYPASAARHVPDASGVLVPRSPGRLVKAVTLSSRKWPHLAGGEHFWLRASVGRVDDLRHADLDNDELARRVDLEVRGLTGLAGSPVEVHVERWPDALPQYDVGHLARVERIRGALRRDAPGLRLAGAALDGIGLAARAREAEELADELADGSAARHA